MQPQGHTQMMTRILAAGQNPQAAIDGPRWRVEGDQVFIEAAVSAEARSGLVARGHRLTEGTLLDFGAAQIIERVRHGYIAGSEGRRDGCAVGF